MANSTVQGAVTSQTLKQAPVVLTAGQQSLYIDLMDQYLDEVMPTMSGRIFGQFIGIFGAFMASKASLALAAIPGGWFATGARVAIMDGGRVIGYTTMRSPTGASIIAKVLSKMESKLGGKTLAELSKGTAGNIAFWSALGLSEDVVKDYDYAMAVWRRQVRPGNGFLRKAPDFAQALGQFVGKLEADVWEADRSEFDQYIREAEADGRLVPFTISKKQLVIAYLWLDASQRWLKQNNTPRGTVNPHVYALQVWVASLIIQLEKNGVDDQLVFSPSYPLYTWTGIPREVAEALNTLYASGAEIQDAYEELGLVDSETFQSLGTSVIQVCTKAGLQALQSSLGGGTLGWLASKGIIGTVKKASPYILRFGDLSN